MDEGQAAQLRARFDPAAVGTLPKPYTRDAVRSRCDECGGYHGLPAAHLPYVGHAAVTDRLLAVDPGWSWEPLALDPAGLPALDGRGNLWIRLTVAGVTRIGVGDGQSAKEVIGDAIRNAAMRFGVALDLWTKEELEHQQTPAQPAPPPEPRPVEAVEDPEPDALPDPDAPQPISRPQMRALQARLKDLGVEDRDERLRIAATVAGRELSSSVELSYAEASALLDLMNAAADHADLMARVYQI